MTTGLDEIDNRIHDLAQRENECHGLFDQIKNGNGENSLRYLAVRDSCKNLRKRIFTNALSAGLTREKIKIDIKKAKSMSL